MKLFSSFHKVKEQEETINNSYYGGFVVSKNVSAGKQVKYTFREQAPKNLKELNGWNIYSYDDDEEYVNNPANFEILSAASVKKICPLMLKIYEAPYGTDICWLYDKKGNLTGFYDLASDKETSLEEILKIDKK